MKMMKIIMMFAVVSLLSSCGKDGIMTSVDGDYKGEIVVSYNDGTAGFKSASYVLGVEKVAMEKLSVQDISGIANIPSFTVKNDLPRSLNKNKESSFNINNKNGELTLKYSFVDGMHIFFVGSKVQQ